MYTCPASELELLYTYTRVDTTYAATCVHSFFCFPRAFNSISIYPEAR